MLPLRHVYLVRHRKTCKLAGMKTHRCAQHIFIKTNRGDLLINLCYLIFSVQNLELACSIYYQYTWNARAVGNYCVSSYWSVHHWDSVYMIFLIFHHCFISLAFNGYLCNRAFGNIGQLASNWAINNKVHVPWYQVVIMMRIYLYQCVNLWGYVLALLGSENNYAYIEMEKLVSWGKAVEVTVVSLNHHVRQHRSHKGRQI